MSYTPPLPDAEPHAVHMTRGSLTDSSRSGRVVPLKLYHPADPGLHDLPLVIWSHGLGGSADGAAFLSRFIASHGYVVVHVQHHGSDSGLWEGKPGHPWDIIRATHIPRSSTIARFQDIPFALDALPDFLAREKPEVFAQVDFTSVGMSGHSFGALTTQVMMGMQFPDEQGILQDYADPRFRAGILYSPVPEFHLSGELSDTVYERMTRPVFHMSGTDDSSPVEGFGYEKRLEVFEHSKGERLLMILKDGDHMVFNGSRGKLGVNANRERHETLIKVAALVYWDAKLKGDKEAWAWLTGEGFATYLSVDGTFEFKN